LARFPCTHPSLVPFTQCRTVIYYYYSPRKRHRVLATAEICARVAVATGEREYFSDVSDPPGHPVRPGLLAAVQKKKKNRRNHRFSSVCTNEGRPKDINRCPLSGVSGVRVRTYTVLRAAYTHTHTHTYTFIRRYVYIYIMCTLHICGGFSFSGEKVVQSEVCASYITHSYIIRVLYII